MPAICSRYLSQYILALVAISPFLAMGVVLDAGLWRCGEPSIFSAPNDPSAPLQWTFSTESCFLNSVSLLNSTIFEVSLTALFDPTALMTASCRNNFYPSLSVTLTDRSREVKLYTGQSNSGVVSISLPPSIFATSSRRPYEAKVVLGPADCTESSLQFSLLAQFAAISSSLTERPVGPLLQRGKVEQGRERLYKFYPSLGRQINQNKRDIFIQLSSLQDADLFVNPPCASGNCFYHRSLSYSARPDTPPLWTSQRPGGAEYIPISHSELSSLMSNYAALNLSDPFALYVSVYGYKPADFTLSLTSSTTVQEWPEVGFVKGDVSEGSYRYYKYVSTQPDQTVYFDLLPTYGDADLTISCFLVATGDDNGYPSRMYHHANFSSQEYKEDTGAILPTNKYTCRPAAPEGIVYYVGVYGFGAASYTLTITRSASVITLTEGIPQSGLTVFKHIGRMFQLYLGFESTSLRITLTSTNGDCDLFVKFGASGAGSGSLASPSLFDYRSTNMGKAVDAISVSESDICQDCVVSIMVYGYYTSTFSLLASLNDGVVVLTDGIPQKGSVAAEKLQYYSFVVSSPIFGLNVSEGSRYRSFVPRSTKLTKQIEKSDVGHGSSSSSRIRIRDEGYYYQEHDGEYYDEVVIDPTPAPITAPPTKKKKSASPTQMPRRKKSTAPMAPSVATSSVAPTTGSALPAELASVTAVLTLLSGSGGGLGAIQQPVLYLSTVYQNPNSSTPNTASSHNQQNNDIQVTLTNVRRGQTVYVAVDSNGLNESYTIRMNEVLNGPTVVPSLLTLLDGIPQVDSISNDDPLGWKYYPIRLHMGHETLNIRMITFVGSVDVYVKRCNLTSVHKCALYQLPTQSKYDYTTVGRDRDDSLSLIRQDDTDAIYLIGVYSQSLYSSYQISTTAADSVLALQAGVSVRDYVEPGKADHFSFYLNKIDEQMRISLTTISGDPDLFVSTTIRNPIYGNSTWSAFRFGSDVLVIDPKTDENACVQCTYFITVASVRPSMYSLMLALESTIPKLSDGHPVSDHVNWLQTNKYTFADSFGAGRDIRIKLTTISGDADMFVTLDGTSPWLDHYDDYTSMQIFSSEEEIFISHADQPVKDNCVSYTDGRSKLCTITIAVFGTLSSDYSISLTTNSSATTLQLGQIQSGTVNPGVDNFYRVRLSKTLSTHALPYTLRITAASRSGFAALYISCLSSTPGINNNIWKVDLIDRLAGSTVDIDSVTAQEKGCHRTCMSGGHIEYYIALRSTVEGAAAAYTISAAVVNDTSVQILVPGHSSIGVVAQNTLSYYYVRLSTDSGSSAAVTQAEVDMTITLSILQGYADVYASLSYTRRPVFNSETRKVDRSIFSTEDDSANSFVMLTTKQISLSHDRIQDLCVQNKSARTDDCYLVLGVLGERVASTRFSLTASFNDATKILSDGVPVLGSVAKNRIEFFKFIVVSNLDLVVSITPFHGDPDVFLSLSQPYPNRGNFTWSQTRTTADTLTIQSSDLARHGCYPAIKICTMYIGVYGFINSTYSLVVSMNQGFAAPIALMDEQMQSGFVGQGQYVYYRYIISTDASTKKASIKFALTPTDGGDQDLYICIGPLDARGQPVNASLFEPGMTHFDYKSAGWSSITDEIKIVAGMRYFCEHCVVYVAVYGYQEGHFSLQASSRGVIALTEGVAVGGRVNLKEYTYYSFYNSVQFAQISIALTTISGDGDLYISTGDSFPTYNDYIWKSSNFGNDVFKLTYDDGSYCTACTYIVGVYGYKNSTFTIMALTSAASIVKLKPNVPQVISVERNQAAYFSSLLASSAADTTVTVTSLNSGNAELYVQIYNASSFASAGGGDQYVLPDPNDPRTYTYTTKRTADNHVFIPATGRAQELVAVITVFATTSARCTIIVTSTQFPVLLQLGIPQNQFVELGQTEHFVVYPDDLEDLRISVTGRSGDPDLLVSTDPNRLPRCTIGSNSWSVNCGNYTWSSRLYSTDQIILSQENPCAAVLASTHVDPSCDPLNSYDPASHKPVYIGVYGYKASKFSILVSAVGQQTQLLAGQPMLSSTSTGFICSDRSATGACLSTSAVQEKIQVSYFSFRVSSNADKSSNTKRRALTWSSDVSQVLITVVPRCNASSSQQLVFSNGSFTPCSPGCDCNPLLLTVNSCPSSKCSVMDRKPSWLPYQHQALLAGVAMGTGSSLLLTGGHTNPKYPVTAGSHMIFSNNLGASSSGPASSGYCDPISAGEDCIYYISVAVSKPTLWNEIATFTVTARTPSDVTLIPCDSQIYPDGIKAVITDSLSAGSSRYYEICGNADDDLLLTLKECTGTTRIYACPDDGQCASVLPTTSSWGFYADPSQSCVHSWNSAVAPSKRDVCTPELSSKVITLQLPKRAGNYFILVQAPTSVADTFTASYTLTAQALKNGQKISPQLMFTGIQDGKVTVSSVSAHGVSLSMRQSWVLLPGARNLVPPDLIVYRVFMGPISGIPTGKSVDQIQCTAEDGYGAYSDLKILKLLVPLNQVGGDLMRVNISGLAASESYWILVQAYCDGACLQQVSKLHPGSGSTSCSSAITSCQTQSIYYLSTTFSTLHASAKDETDATDSSGEKSDTSQSSSLTANAIVLSLVVVFACALALIAAFVYWKRNVSPTSGDYEWIIHMTGFGWGRKNMDDSSHSSAEMINMERSTHISSSSSSSYQPPNSSADLGQADAAGWRGAMGKMVGLVQEAPRKYFGEIKIRGSVYSKASNEEIDFR